MQINPTLWIKSMFLFWCPPAGISPDRFCEAENYRPQQSSSPRCCSVCSLQCHRSKSKQRKWEIPVETLASQLSLLHTGREQHSLGCPALKISWNPSCLPFLMCTEQTHFKGSRGRCCLQCLPTLMLLWCFIRDETQRNVYLLLHSPCQLI